MYSLSDYLWMIADEPRAAAYAKALRAAITPGDRVVEVGTGFGFFAVVAARAGAGHVDAVDTNPVIHLGPRVAALNGCEDRITFRHSAVADVSLPIPADVLLIDVRGPTPFGSRALEILIDARDRLLRPGGRIIAREDRVMVAPVRTPQTFRREVVQAHGREEVLLEPVERIVFDTPMACTIAADDVVAPEQCWVVLDYQTITDTDTSGAVRWQLDRVTTIAGLAVWFETDLGHGLSFSSGPGGTVATYRQLFIPFRGPVTLDAGDGLRVELSTRQVGDSYVWAWRTWRRPSHSPTEELVGDQNSLAELVLDPAAVPRTSEDTAPSLGPRGAALRALLARLDGHHTIGALATDLAADSPGLFRDRRAAQNFIANWVCRLEGLEHGGG